MAMHRTEGEIVEELATLKGPDFRAYREHWDAANRFELETDFPLFLHIEPNYVCNFRCSMCTQGIPELKARFGYEESLSTADIARILDEARRHGCPSISFQGDNEPFLIKPITDWFAMARDAGFLDIMVNTNGSAMTPDLARRIVESGLTRIRFSLDAVTEETYARIRIGGNFAKVTRNIMTLLETRARLNSPLPKVGVNFVKMAVNSVELEPFLAHWGSIVDFVVVQDYMTPDIDGDYHALDVAGRVTEDEFRCAQPWQRLYIRGNGDVTPCCAMFSSRLTLGNVREQSLHALWHSPQAVALRRLHAEGRFRENPICLKCSKSGAQGDAPDQAP
jgi:radical SAM protein with 4Fe4S-binding SPASM domain